MDDIKILKSLAWQVKEISEKPIQNQRREIWSDHNSLKKGPVPVFLNCGDWDVIGSEILTSEKLHCNDSFFREIEFNLRNKIFIDSVNDDSITEPWYTIRPVFACTGWGVKINRFWREDSATYHLEPAVSDDDDLRKLITPRHEINEELTQNNYERTLEAIGDILPVYLDKAPFYTDFEGDVSYWLGQLAGFEKILYQMYDKPEWLHKLLAHLRDGIGKTHAEAEASGHWTSASGHNQAMCYSHDIPCPNHEKTMPMNQIWGYFAAQEFEPVSPEMHKEFLLDYQMPLMEKFGLIAYGCCEDLTNKITMLRSIPNLRRIAVSPFADVKKCVEQIERDYVISYRPNPASMAVTDWKPKEAALSIKKELEFLKDSIFDVCMKDVTTVRGEVNRLADWVKAVKELV